MLLAISIKYSVLRNWKISFYKMFFKNFFGRDMSRIIVTLLWFISVCYELSI